MGEGQGWLWEPSFNRSIKVRKGDERLSGDAGLLLFRESDHRLSLTADMAARIRDPRDPDKTRYTAAELLRHLTNRRRSHSDEPRDQPNEPTRLLPTCGY